MFGLECFMSRADVGYMIFAALIKLYVCQDACPVRVGFASEVKQRIKNSIARSLPSSLGVGIVKVTQLALEQLGNQELLRLLQLKEGRRLQEAYALRLSLFQAKQDL
jgi:hypothetical protein